MNTPLKILLPVLLFILFSTTGKAETTGILCINLTSTITADENCGQGNGSITLVHDGTAPFTYAWSHDNTLNDSIASNLPAGSYTVSISDAAGCTAQTTVTLSNTPAPVVSLESTTDASCFGKADGGATISTNSTSHTITWNSNPAQSGTVLSNVAGGTYTATVTDTFGCQSFITVNINQPAPMALVGATTPDTCGAPNGTAIVNVVPGAGVGPYTYQWGNNAGNQTTQMATGLTSGLYNVTVTDSRGCQGIQTFNVTTDDNGFTGAIDFVNNATCSGDTDGGAAVIASGGNGSYSYEWFPINDPNDILGTGASISGLPKGVFVVKVSDALGDRCTFNVAVNIQEPEPVDPNVAVIQAIGCRTADGQAFVAPSGGTSPYSILWSTGEVTDSITNLQPDFYSVTVTDTFGCNSTQDFLIRSQAGPNFKVDTVQEDNCGLGEGIVQIRIESGRAPFRAVWSTVSPQPTDTSMIAFNLEKTDVEAYHVTLIDADTCIQRRHFGMPGNDPLEVVSLDTVPEYCELGNGSATIVVTGGTLPYSYRWTTSPQQTTQTATNLIGGDYKVTVTDSFLCHIEADLIITEEIGFSMDVTAIDETCYGDNDGSVMALVTGARGDVIYSWPAVPQQIGPMITDLGDGVYNVTARDSEGCERSGFGIVGSKQLIEAEFAFQPDTVTPVVITSSGFAFFNRSEGGTEYLWDFGDGTTSTQSSPFHVYADTGTYYVTLTVTDSAGVCVDERTHGPFVVVEDGSLFMPDAFSPNGDGFNDLLSIGGALIVDFELRIFNRWGQEVFSTQTPSDAWDGRTKSGKLAPEGVYVYALTATIPGENPIRQKGTITLLR